MRTDTIGLFMLLCICTGCVQNIRSSKRCPHLLDNISKLDNKKPLTLEAVMKECGEPRRYDNERLLTWYVFQHTVTERHTETNKERRHKKSNRKWKKKIYYRFGNSLPELSPMHLEHFLKPKKEQRHLLYEFVVLLNDQHEIASWNLICLH